MYVYKKAGDEIGNNKLIINSDLNGSMVYFHDKAENNILVIEKNANIANCKIYFQGKNSLVYLSEIYTKSIKKLRIEVYDNAVFYMGKGTTVKSNHLLSAIVGSNTNCFIGDDSMLSEQILIRTVDAHNILDYNTLNIVNPSASVMIGDHVWIALDVSIYKGSTIGSGAIIGANSRCFGGKAYASNNTYGGYPAKILNSDVVWERKANHKAQNTYYNMQDDLEYFANFKFQHDDNTISLKDLDRKLIAASTAEEKLKILENLPKSKNRFYISSGSIEKKPVEIEDVNEFEIADIFWENTYLHIVLEEPEKAIYLYRKKNEEKIFMDKVDDKHFKINVVNVPTKQKVLYGEYIVFNSNKKRLGLSNKCHEKVSKLDKIYRFSNGRVYAGFVKTSGYYPKFNFQYYINSGIPPIEKPVLTLTSKKKRFFEKLLKTTLQKSYKFFRLFSRKSNNKVLLLTLSSDEIGGNLKAMSEYIDTVKDEYNIKKKEIAINVSKLGLIKKGKIYLRLIPVIAKYNTILIDNHTSIFDYFILDEKQKLIQLWHAGVGFKAVGYARFGKDGSPDLLKCGHRQYTGAIAPTPRAIEIYEDVFGIAKDKFLVCGLPRLEKTIKQKDEVKKNVMNEFPFMKNKTNVLFAPTYRGKNQKNANYPIHKWLDLDLLNEFAKANNINILLKMHPFISKNILEDYENYSNIIDVSKDADMNEILLASDALLTDYSSNVYEAALFEKPIIIFAPDQIDYEQTRGVHRKLEDFCGSDVATDTDSLISKISNLEIKDWQNKFRFEEVEIGQPGASEKIFETFILEKNK